MSGDFEVWNSYGEPFAKVAKKGTAVLIEGKLRPRVYTRKEDGVTVYGYRLRVDRWFGNRQENRTNPHFPRNLPCTLPDRPPYHRPARAEWVDARVAKGGRL
jgi:hypothetical protein